MCVVHTHDGAQADAAELLVALLNINRLLKSRVPHDPATMLLHYFGGGPLRVSDLAGCAALDHSTVSRYVKRLEELGLVERASDPDDRRVSRLVITPAGREALHEAKMVRAAVLAEVLASWPEADRRTLGDLVRHLSAALEQHGGASGPDPSHP